MSCIFFISFKTLLWTNAVFSVISITSPLFILEKSSDMFYRPDDELIYEVGRKTVAGNTDRFSLVFRKPMN